MTTEYDSNEFEILHEVTDRMDPLPPEKQRQIMSMLATRYGMKLILPTDIRPNNYRYTPRKFVRQRDG